MNKDSNLKFQASNPDDYILIKFGKREHLERINNGILRFNKLSYYRNIEEKDEKKCSAIADKNEGLSMLLNNNDKPVSTPRVNFIKVFPDALSNKYVFCLSCLRAKEINKSTIDAIIKCFPEYDYILYYKNGLNFIINVLKSLERCNPRFDRIRYQDFSKSLIGADEFTKCNSYAYQRECRFSMDYSVQDINGITRISEETIEIAFEKVSGIIVPITEFRPPF